MKGTAMITTRKALAAVATAALATGFAWHATTPAPAPTPATVAVTGAMMTREVGMITGDLIIRTENPVAVKYAGTADWYTADRCPTEDSVACVWVGTADGNRRGALVINARTD